MLVRSALYTLVWQARNRPMPFARSLHPSSSPIRSIPRFPHFARACQFPSPIHPRLSVGLLRTCTARCHDLGPMRSPRIGAAKGAVRLLPLTPYNLTCMSASHPACATKDDPLFADNHRLGVTLFVQHYPLADF